MRKCWLGFLGILLVTAGCSQGPARIAAPNVDPESAADSAIELYDTDHDGSLKKAELAACPAVLAYLSLYDQNSDGLVSRDEFAARLNELYGKRVGLSHVDCQITFQGRPLQDAIVVFEPEPYLGDEIPAANAITGANGSAPMAVAAEYLPENLRARNRQLMKVGTYKVRITHPKIALPAKYNTNTTLGYETQLGNPFARFELTAK
jgi:hypothetical protein